MIADVWPLVAADSMRALDRHTIEALGVAGDVLMESAGRSVAERVLESLEPGGEVLVVCGSGNNGGDGLVVARQLRALGVGVRAALLAEPGSYRGDAAANLERARAAGVPLEGSRWKAPAGGVVVDAIFGTGLTRRVDGPAASAIRRITASRPACRVVAVDLPSGLHADTGQPLGAAVQADVTVTMGLPKLGLALEPGRSLAGRIWVARIGIADEAPDVTADAELWTRAAAGARLPARPADGHKGGFGHVLLVAASEGKTGAAALAAEGAGRMGAGRVTVACPAGLNDVLELKCTEAMTAPLPDTAERGLGASAEETILGLAATREAVGLGPGLGRSEETVQLVRAVSKRLEQPLVIDADGLYAFADEPAILKARRGVTILTPHPGEAARLLSSSAADVNRDRVGAARELAAQTGAVVLLKGAATVTASPEAPLCVVVNPTGGPALASGGTGDVLLGMVAALLGQGLEPLEAAATAAYVHGHAADRIASRWGSSGLLAGDLARELPAATGELREAARSAARPRLGSRLAVSCPEP